ncbi:MAG: endonuclease [Thermoleophilia bacterium]|nr:endonuclease [Thermoleophilia bacterium]
MIPPEPKGASMRPGPVKVLTINVKAFQGSDGGTVDTKALDAIERYIEKTDADVVLFQELDNGTARSGRSDQLADISRRVGANDSQFAKALDHDGGAYGVGMLTRNGYSIRDAAGGGNATSRVELPKSSAKGADGEQRVALVAPIVAPDGSQFTAVSTHLANKGPGRSAQVRGLQAIVDDAHGGARNRAAGLRDDLPTSVVLGGDFNTQRGPIEGILHGVSHVATQSTVGDTNIDHIYVSSDVQVHDAQLDDPEVIRGHWEPWKRDVRATDHPALLATLQLR